MGQHESKVETGWHGPKVEMGRKPKVETGRHKLKVEMRRFGLNQRLRPVD